jgi:hypothetical protein
MIDGHRLVRSTCFDETVLIRGWVFRLRTLANTTFLVVRDCTGDVQCVMATGRFKELHLKLDDAVELVGRVRRDHRAKSGCEMDIEELRVLNAASNKLPFNSSSKIGEVGQEARLEYQGPLSLRSVISLTTSLSPIWLRTNRSVGLELPFRSPEFDSGVQPGPGFRTRQPGTNVAHGSGPIHEEPGAPLAFA